MTQTKEIISLEELQALKQWFDSHKAQLPATLEFPAMKIENLPASVENFFELAFNNHQNPTFTTQIKWLYKIKEKIEAGV